MITVSIAGGSRPEILELVKQARERYVEQLAFVVFDTVENIGDDSLWTYYLCQSDVEVAEKAVSYVAEGSAQILLKGIIQTHTLLKELVNERYGLKTKKVLSHVAMVELPSSKQSFLLTDCAMNITPTKETILAIVENAKEVAHKIGLVLPKIALLSAAENFNPKMPSSVLAKETAEHFQDIDDGLVFGPLSFDLALSKEAVAHKRYEGPIMGDADVLVVPTIDTGNALYKALTIFAGAKVGGTIVGAKVPVVLTSRSDSTQSKLHSLEFAMKQL
ncbi:branched-chain phosphotransacylase [Enterococcus sp. AZ194]|uniref:phosphate acyltransferase n=1 Tax=Enterococcus sp. AZ194 TaxID=2774629 RepID=UPI003F27A746